MNSVMVILCVGSVFSNVLMSCLAKIGRLSHSNL